MTQMPIDDNGEAMPILFFRDNGAHTVSPSGSSARNTTAFDPTTSAITVYASAAMTFKLGASDVTAATTDHYLPANYPLDIATKGRRYIAFYGTGSVRISERE